MYIKTFTSAEEANTFIDSVVVEDNGVQYTNDGQIIVFYKYTKDGYQDAYKAEVLEKLRRELFHAELAWEAAKVEKAEYQDSAMQEELQAAAEKEKGAKKSYDIYKAKITVLEGWTAKSS